MSIFKFKKFDVNQTNAPQKIGTDAMVLGALVKPITDSNDKIEHAKRILDVGTGCGVIALMLSQNNPNADITGIDIDEQAVLQAESNFKIATLPPFNFENQFESLQHNFLEFSPNYKFDLIVSNPPYFNSKMPSADEQRSLARHENSMSLQGLINHSAKLLTRNGKLWIIVPSERTEELMEEKLNLDLEKKIRIYGKPGRHVRDVLVFSKHQNRLTGIVTELTIRDAEGEYTEQYKELTIEFHYNKL